MPRVRTTPREHEAEAQQLTWQTVPLARFITSCFGLRSTCTEDQLHTAARTLLAEVDGHSAAARIAPDRGQRLIAQLLEQRLVVHQPQDARFHLPDASRQLVAQLRKLTDIERQELEQQADAAMRSTPPPTPDPSARQLVVLSPGAPVASIPELVANTRIAAFLLARLRRTCAPDADRSYAASALRGELLLGLAEVLDLRPEALDGQQVGAALRALVVERYLEPLPDGGRPSRYRPTKEGVALASHGRKVAPRFDDGEGRPSRARGVSAQLLVQDDAVGGWILARARTMLRRNRDDSFPAKELSALLRDCLAQLLRVPVKRIPAKDPGFAIGGLARRGWLAPGPFQGGQSSYALTPEGQAHACSHSPDDPPALA